MANMISLSLGIEFFADPLNGRGIINGDIYIGQAGLDPEIEANRITVNIQEQDGTLVPVLPAGQPLNTGGGGVILYNGSPVSILIDNDPITSYSLKVLDENGALKYYNPSVIDNSNTDYVLKSGDTMVGQLKTPNDPVAAEDMTRKSWVESAIASYVLDTVFPVGSYFIGADPAGTIGGGWAQISDKTFLMNTTTAEASGGLNDQTLTVDQMPSHDHGGGAHAHDYWSNWNGTTDGSGNDIGIMGSSGINGLVNHRQLHSSETTNSVIPNEGGGASFDNRPKFESVQIWKRIA